jgi:predicted nucleotidyltransferase component of viral defense system
MGKTILTTRQLDFLELAQTHAYIVKNFYLTGGTALAAFYYFHRLSEDIDLFCEKQEVDPNLVETFLKKISPKLHVIRLKGIQTLGLVSFKLIYRDGEELKVDFNYYPNPRIEKGTKFKNLDIDSVYDIAANKIHTVFMKPRLRDYIDLYFIFKKENYNLDDLIINSKAKFDWDIDRVNLTSQFLRAKDFLKETKAFPKMLVPFNPKEMENFFLKLAKSLEGEIFKN